MSKEELMEKFKTAVVDMDADMAIEAANEALTEGIDPLECIEGGLADGMQAVSDLFDEGEAFVPELMESSEAFSAALEVLVGAMSDEDKASSKAGVVVIHTVEGDIHDIGKNIVTMLFEANNFDIYDLGRDTPPQDVLDKAEEVNADIIAGSALMTTTMPGAKALMELLIAEGVRDKYFVMFGGAPVTQEFCDSIGANAYTETATEAVAAAKKYMASK